MTSQNSQHHQNLAVLREIVEDELARHSSSVTDLEMLDAVRPRYDQHPRSSGEIVRVGLDSTPLFSDHIATFVVRNPDETFTAFILSEVIIDALPGGHVKVWGFQVFWDDEYEKIVKVWDACSNLEDLRQKRLSLPHKADKWDLYQLAQQVWSICHQIAEILEVDEYTLEEDVPSVINRILRYVFLVHIGEAKVEKERIVVADRENSGLEPTQRVMQATGLWLQEGGILGFGDSSVFRPISYAYQWFRVGPEYTGGIMEKWIDDAKVLHSERAARDLLNDIANSGVSYSGSIDFDWQDIYSHIPGFCDDLSDIESVRKIVEENTHEYAVSGFAMRDDLSGRPTYVYLIDDGQPFWRSWTPE